MTDHHDPTRHRRRIALACVATAAVTIGVVGCSSAGRGAREQVIASITSGTWNCAAGRGKSSIQIEAGKDGSFEIRPLGKQRDEEPAIGSWKVVDKEVSLRLGLEDGTQLLDVRGFDDLEAKAGTITVQDPEHTDRTATFEVAVRGTDTIAITPDDRSSDEFPSGTWTCERR